MVKSDVSDRLDRSVAAEGKLYEIVRSRILSKMQSGEWRSGERLPAEPELALMFDVSVGTVRKAVDTLAEQRILTRRHGSGTYVTGSTRETFLDSVFSFVDRKDRRIDTTFRVVSMRLTSPSEEAAEVFRLGPGQKVFRLRNIRLVDNVPLLFDDIQVPQNRFPHLTVRDFREADAGTTVLDLLMKQSSGHVVRVEERIEAIGATASVAEMLQIKPNAPLLHIERIAYSFGNIPVELRNRLVHTKAARYFNNWGVKS
ncbi:GntR family transcriptional regulator [Sphingobium phenoxybenzoativorans]|uniref:GntR family transcriptional regulator n=1 Tax=Sphingobium phenoxybenzoativorans TaxID=1592790 RepID=UPI0008733C42|nr:GntR family transcriptional regulator [Sphingobium phenoxybenzoativorans]